MKRTLSILILTLTSFFCASAQKPCFEHLNISDGLSQSTVNAIIQDSRGFLWFGTKDGLNRYDGEHFKIFRHIPGREDGLGNNQIRSLAEDRNGDIWIGTNSGLFIYSTATGTISAKRVEDSEGNDVQNTILSLKCSADGTMYAAVERVGVFSQKPDSTDLELVLPTTSPLRCIEIDNSTGTIWFSWSGNGLYFTCDGFKTYKPYLVDGGDRIFPADIISSILVSAFNRIYLGLEGNGLLELNKATGKITRIPLARKPPFVRNILQYSPEELWVGTESGIYIYNIVSGSVQNLTSSPFDRWSLSDNAIHSICKDRDGGIWIGTFFGGVDYLPQRIPDFNKFYYSDEPGGLKGRRIRRICPDGEGCLWIATEDEGLFHFDPQSGKFRHLPQSDDFTNVQTLMRDGDDLWIGTFSKGLKVINTKTNATRSYEFVKEPGPRLFSNNIFALVPSSCGRIYVGTMHGLQFYDRQIDGFGYVPQINGGKMVNDILEDSRGNLWVGTLSNGLYVQWGKDGQWRQFLHDDSCEGSVPGNNIISIFEDSKGGVWVATYGDGFCKWNPDEGTFTTWNSLSGMPSDVVYQILEDATGDFWISTNKGLVLFDPSSCTVKRTYTTDDGLLCDQFNYNSSCNDGEGNLYFGSIEGMISFNPMNLHGKKPYDRTPEIYVTGFSLPGEGPGGRFPLKQDIICTDHITLKYDQNTFSLQLASLSYAQDNTIIYRMEGLEQSWRQYNGGEVTYSKLPAGDYVFRARLKGYDGPDADRTLGIRVRPPWWRSTLANLIYIIFFFSLVMAGSFLFHRQSVLKRKKYIKAYEMAKEREVYDTKITFFTNITHEIRTPLTLIKGPLDNILSKDGLEPKVRRDLDIMKRNTDRLLVLVNQLLDFQKIEKENLQLELSEEDVPRILEDVAGRFEGTAAWQNKRWRVSIKDRDIRAMANREAFTKILSNLLTNAVKYSDSEIEIILEKDGGNLRLIVRNDGPVVPQDKKKEIFAPFYRHTNSNEKTGTGIGLYLAKSLAELQKGTLEMSADTDRNEFILTMPLCGAPEERSVKTEGVSEEESRKEAERNEEAAREEGSRDETLVLVVEDDIEMCGFICNSLEEKWKVLSAHNGKEALEVLDGNNVSIIVSDIMMPQMDGIELCQTVRSDIRYTHIPVVLLTAKTTLESKIEGMNVGADAYVEKPFSLPYLISVIANQIKIRQQLREAFLKNPLASMNSVNLSTGDTSFMTRLQDVVNENLSNPKFRMDDIAEMMNMSRANFYRKIKGVLDMSPNDYLRLERLKKAARLLAENDLQVSEVCYMVGFSSPSYFAKCFHSQFGMHPKNFVSSLSKDGTPTEQTK